MADERSHGPGSWLPKVVGVGIDFGMTYSGAAIAFEMPGGALSIEAVPINNVVGEDKFPTAIYVSPDLRITDVGDDARNHEDAENCYELFKRFLGTRWTPRSEVDGVYLTKLLLESVKRNIDDFLRRKGIDREQVKRKYVFTFPGTWEQERILAMKSAIEQAGFGHDYTLLDEAIATAIGAAQVGGNVHMLGEQQTTFICDFGGGTTDFSLIQATAMGLIRVKFAAGGNPLLGMSNLDKVIAMLIADNMNQLQPSGQRVLRQHIVTGAELEAAWSEYRPNPRWKAGLLRKGESIKRNAFTKWSDWESDVIRAPDGQFKEITKAQLEPFVDTMINTLRQNVHAYLTESVERGKLPRDIVRFIVVGGGGSALPGIGAALMREIPGNTELLQIDPKIARSLVQRGAAFHGLDSTIYDRRSLHTYGVKSYKAEKPPYYVPEQELAYGDLLHGERPTYYPWYEVYVSRNDKITPGSKITRPFTPLRANQNSVTFEVLAGEDPNPIQNKRLGEVVLPLPPRAGKDYHIDCEFTIGKDNLLLIRAVGKDKQEVEVTLRWQADRLDQ